MIITFFSNYLNHHQLPLCLEFIKVVGEDNFHFVATETISEERLSLGYEDMNEKYSFVIKEYLNDENSRESRQLACLSDIAIFTPSAFHFCEERLTQKKISFLYIERQFKRGIISLGHPRVFNRYFSYIKYRRAPLYILCAGAFVADDLSIFGFPREKCFKWGYFPNVDTLDIDSIISKRGNVPFRLMWCARFIPWKRPDYPIRLANILKSKGYDFQLDMYGNGVLLDKAKALVRSYKLNDNVHFYGSVPNSDVVNAMRTHNALLFTSNKREGWGAVANESMANGCTLVASDAIGAIPYLIQNGKNGIIFKSNSHKSLLHSVETLINNPTYCEELAKQAYVTISTLWTAKNAVSNLISLYKNLNGQTYIYISDGPCSNA